MTVEEILAELRRVGNRQPFVDPHFLVLHVAHKLQRRLAALQLTPAIVERHSQPLQLLGDGDTMRLDAFELKSSVEAFSPNYQLLVLFHDTKFNEAVAPKETTIDAVFR